jgi:hypothetical protein
VLISGQSRGLIIKYVQTLQCLCSFHVVTLMFFFRTHISSWITLGQILMYPSMLELLQFCMSIRQLQSSKVWRDGNKSFLGEQQITHSCARKQNSHTLNWAQLYRTKCTRAVCERLISSFNIFVMCHIWIKLRDKTHFPLGAHDCRIILAVCVRSGNIAAQHKTHLMPEFSNKIQEREALVI